MALTFYDAVQYGLQYLGSHGAGTGEAITSVRRAVLQSLGSVGSEVEWSYLQREGRVITSPPYATGTIAYTSSTREMVLTGGTWPTWAEEGLVLVGTQWYEVEKRVSGTQLLLLATAAPAADLSSGTSYTLYRDRYDLPADFQRLLSPVVHQYSPLDLVTPQEMLLQRSGSPSSGIPSIACLMGSPIGRQQMILRVWPLPSQESTIHFVYKRQPRSAQIYQYSTGTVAVTSGSPTVTGTGTAFTSLMAGSLFRLSSDGTNLPGAIHDNYPALFEAYVAERNSDTTLTLASNATVTASARKFLVSDPLDIDELVMGDLFHRSLCKFLAMDRKFEAGLRQLATQEYALELRAAMALDRRHYQERVVMGSPGYSRGFRLLPDQEA